MLSLQDLQAIEQSTLYVAGLNFRSTEQLVSHSVEKDNFLSFWVLA